ncbi:MAG: DUF5131 family protein [Gammaproteobacteria bacterium]|nr:MAG: DUF5131 family protein [Gammaproteobacteria bacterium]
MVGEYSWCDWVWNPIIGCNSVSTGCLNCYARTHVERSSGRRFGKLLVNKQVLYDPLRTHKSHMVYVSALGDLFHRKVPKDILLEIFDVMRRAEHIVFLVSTRRAGRAVEFLSQRKIPDNIWVGVSAEDRETANNRLASFKRLDFPRKFLVLEPLLGPIELDLTGIKQVVIGGELGPNARPCYLVSILDVVEHCRLEGVPYYIKNIGSFPVHNGIRYQLSETESSNSNNWPKILRPRGQLVMRASLHEYSGTS